MDERWKARGKTQSVWTRIPTFSRLSIFRTRLGEIMKKWPRFYPHASPDAWGKRGFWPKFPPDLGGGSCWWKKGVHDETQTDTWRQGLWWLSNIRGFIQPKENRYERSQTRSVRILAWSWFRWRKGWMKRVKISWTTKQAIVLWLLVTSSLIVARFVVKFVEMVIGYVWLIRLAEKLSWKTKPE